MGEPKYFTNLKTPFADNYFMVDSNGRVWSDMVSATGNWRFTGNTTSATSLGNGLISYVPSNSGTSALGYIFVFRQFQIDYATITSNTTLTWTYGWNPATGTSGNSNYLNCYNTGSNVYSHEALLAPDNVVYYCDGRYIGRWFEETGQNFDPSNTATYVADNTALLPTNDNSTCLAFLGTNLMIGGQKNIIYPWDTTSPTFSYPLAIAESYISKMVTINTNTFIFPGNRGRIYYTNGSQAQLYKKLPDHISGTVEPYFTWGGVSTTKNQLYFSALCTTNSGSSITAYGGVWAIDVDTRALRMTNKLSYGTYAGYASAIIAIIYNTPSSNPGGAGLYIGWNSGASTYGIDKTLSTLYTNGETTIDSDYIPIGTFLEPATNSTVEFKLATPVTTGESIKLQYRQKLSDSFSDCGTTVFSYATSTAGGGTAWNGYGGVYQNVNFQNSQWIQIRAVLTGGSSNPSYVRLTEIRLK